MVSLLQSYLLLCQGNSSFQQPLGKGLQEAARSLWPAQSFLPRRLPLPQKWQQKSVPAAPWLPQGGQAWVGFIANHSQGEGLITSFLGCVSRGLRARTKAEQALQGLLLQIHTGSTHHRKCWNIISFYDLVKVKFQSSHYSKKLEIFDICSLYCVEEKQNCLVCSGFKIETTTSFWGLT